MKTFITAALAMVLALALIGCQPDEAFVEAFPYVWKIVSGAAVFLFTRLALRNVFLRDLLFRGGVAAEHVVLDVERTHVEKVKEGKDPNSPGGVTLTPEEARGARRAALEKLLEILGGKGLLLLGWILGVSKGTIETILGTVTEAGVHKLGMAQAAVKNGAAKATSPPR